MKIWESCSDTVFIKGPDRGVVSIIGESSLYRRNGKDLEYIDYEDPEDDREWVSIDHWDCGTIFQAIRKLWPSPTKKRLWRHVARLAGELNFGVSSAGSFRVAHFSSCSDSVKQLMIDAKEWSTNGIGDPVEKKRVSRILVKLDKAYKAWETFSTEESK
jgi:hypothetical protein